MDGYRLVTCFLWMEYCTGLNFGVPKSYCLDVSEFEFDRFINSASECFTVFVSEKKDCLNEVSKEYWLYKREDPDFKIYIGRKIYVKDGGDI